MLSCCKQGPFDCFCRSGWTAWFLMLNHVPQPSALEASLKADRSSQAFTQQCLRTTLLPALSPRAFWSIYTLACDSPNSGVILPVLQLGGPQKSLPLSLSLGLSNLPGGLFLPFPSPLPRTRDPLAVLLGHTCTQSLSAC